MLPSVIRPISEVSVIHWCLLSSNRSVMMELIDPATSVACSGDCNLALYSITPFVRQTCTIQLPQCTTSHRLRHCTCELHCSQPIASVGLPACHTSSVSAAAVLGMESSTAHGHIAPARALLLVHVRHDVDKHGSLSYPPPTREHARLLSSSPELTCRPVGCESIDLSASTAESGSTLSARGITSHQISTVQKALHVVSRAARLAVDKHISHR